jgi:hypothetical protein
MFYMLSPVKIEFWGLGYFIFFASATPVCRPSSASGLYCFGRAIQRSGSPLDTATPGVANYDSNMRFDDFAGKKAPGDSLRFVSYQFRSSRKWIIAQLYKSYAQDPLFCPFRPTQARSMSVFRDMLSAVK